MLTLTVVNMPMTLSGKSSTTSGSLIFRLHIDNFGYILTYLFQFIKHFSLSGFQLALQIKLTAMPNSKIIGIHLTNCCCVGKS